jgi:transposase
MAIVKQHDKRIGTTYAYESISYWDREKQQSRSKRHLIGIVDPITGEIKPTTKNKRNSLTPIDISWLTAERRFHGATYLFDRVGEVTGVANDLKYCFPDCYKQILSIAYYLILEDKNPLSRFPQWSKLHTHPYGDVISSQRSSELFAEITESQRMNFFRLQGTRHTESEYWAYDTTSISSYSELLRQVRRGKNKDHDPLPQINLALLYGQESGLPFYYKKLAGNISDVSTVKQLLIDMEFLGHKGIKFVFDRGFYSGKNINDLYSERLKFLMGVKLSLKYVSAELDNQREAIRNWHNLMPESEAFGLTVPTHWQYKYIRPNKSDEVTVKRRMYLHLYYDSVKAIEDERDFSKLMCQLKHELLSGNHEKSNKSLYEQYFTVKTTPVRGTKVTAKEDVIAAERKNFGYFALIGNERLNPSQALSTYRNKDVAEKAFDNIKDRLDMRRLNVSSDLSLDGKLFVVFVALIFISFLHNAMKRTNLYHKYTMNELLGELEMIERFERHGYKPQIGEVTTKQNDIYAALNIVPPKSSLG